MSLMIPLFFLSFEGGDLRLTCPLSQLPSTVDERVLLS